MTIPIEISTKEQVEHVLQTYDNFLFDCDGVIWLDETLIPGVLDTIKLLESKGKKFAFITNNSSKSRNEYVAKFERLGFKGVSKDTIYPTCYAAALQIKEELKIPVGAKIWVLGDNGIEEELREQGYIPIGGSDPRLDEEFSFDHPLLKIDPDVKAVVVGSTKKFNYLRIAVTLQYLLHNNKLLPFIGTNIDRSYPAQDGLILPAGGSVVNFMEYTAHRDFINVGKPSPIFLDTVVKHQAFDKKTTVMVGDTLYTDIKFGNDGGLADGKGSILVLTGGTKAVDLLPLPKDESTIPTYIIRSLGDIYELEK